MVRISKPENSDSEIIVIEPDKPLPTGYCRLNTHLLQFCHRIFTRGNKFHLADFAHRCHFSESVECWNRNNTNITLNVHQCNRVINNENYTSATEYFFIKSTVATTKILKNNFKNILQVIQRNLGM